MACQYAPRVDCCNTPSGNMKEIFFCCKANGSDATTQHFIHTMDPESKFRASICHSYAHRVSIPTCWTHLEIVAYLKFIYGFGPLVQVRKVL